MAPYTDSQCLALKSKHASCSDAKQAADVLDIGAFAQSLNQDSDLFGCLQVMLRDEV